MGNLGALGVVHQPKTPEQDEPDTFDWFGESIRCKTEVDEIELVDVMASFSELDTEGVAALGALKKGLAMLVHPEDFGLFWRLAKENRQDIEDLMEAFRVLLFRPVDRPTQQQSGSSTGLLPTTENSQVALPSPGSSGRPDIQVIRDDMNEWRARKAAALASG